MISIILQTQKLPKALSKQQIADQFSVKKKQKTKNGEAYFLFALEKWALINLLGVKLQGDCGNIYKYFSDDEQMIQTHDLM